MSDMLGNLDAWEAGPDDAQALTKPSGRVHDVDISEDNIAGLWDAAGERTTDPALRTRLVIYSIGAGITPDELGDMIRFAVA